MSEDHRILPVWFFVGVILLIYGILILATGLYEFSHPRPPCLRICTPQFGGERCSPSRAAPMSTFIRRENPEPWRAQAAFNPNSRCLTDPPSG
jgi:hypothetical protein